MATRDFTLEEVGVGGACLHLFKVFTFGRRRKSSGGGGPLIFIMLVLGLHIDLEQIKILKPHPNSCRW